jgi:hypothetical protein
VTASDRNNVMHLMHECNAAPLLSPALVFSSFASIVYG